MLNESRDSTHIHRSTRGGTMCTDITAAFGHESGSLTLRSALHLADGRQTSHRALS